MIEISMLAICRAMEISLVIGQASFRENSIN